MSTNLPMRESAIRRKPHRKTRAEPLGKSAGDYNPEVTGSHEESYPGNSVPETLRCGCGTAFSFTRNDRTAPPSILPYFNPLLSLSLGETELLKLGSTVTDADTVVRADGLVDQVNRLLAELVLLGRPPLCVRRRKVNRAFELVCVELNPGPKKKSKTSKVKVSKVVTVLGGRSPAEIRSNQVTSSMARAQMGARKQGGVPRGLQDGTASEMAMYRAVLDNPFDNMPVRLGGETMQPTGLATLTLRTQITTSSSGNFSLVLYPWGAGGIWYSATSANPYTYGASGLSFPQASSLASICTGARVVAAGVRITTLASATNDQGLVVLGCLPRDTLGTSFNSLGGFPVIASTTATQGFNEFQNYLSTESYPLKCGASAIWRPEDPIDFTFRNLVVQGSSASDIAGGSSLSPFFVVGVTGAANASACYLEYIVHLEYTVNEGTTGVISTGMGKMTSPETFKVAKTFLGGLIDTTFQGVTGGLVQAAGNLALRAGKALGRTAANAFSSSDFTPYSGKSYNI